MCPARSSAVALLLTAALLPVSGCATPGVVVEGTSLASDSAVGGPATKVNLLLRLTNPADEPMRLLVSEYSFRGAEASYGGQWETLATIPPRESIELRLPVVLDTASFDQTGAWGANGSIVYRSPSRIARIFNDLGLYTPRASFSGSGVGVGPANPAGPTAPAFRNSAAPAATEGGSGASGVR